MSYNPEQLGAFEWRMVRLYCPDCHQFAQFSKTGLIERFGGKDSWPLTAHQVEPCARRTEGVGAVPCQLRYWDLMSREAREKALAEMAANCGLPKGWTAEWVAKKIAASSPVRISPPLCRHLWGKMAALV